MNRPQVDDKAGLHDLLAPTVASLVKIAFILVALAAVAFEYPRSIAVPFVILAAWAGLGLLYKAYQLRAQR